MDAERLGAGSLLFPPRLDSSRASEPPSWSRAACRNADPLCAQRKFPRRIARPKVAARKVDYQQLMQWRPEWVFAYGSLMWRADLVPLEWQLARVHGWHRALSVYAIGGRGSPQQPGLWFALEPGGSVTGTALRLHPRHVETQLERIWRREMPDSAYRAVKVVCRLADGRVVQALAFAANPASRLHAPRLAPVQVSRLLLQGRGPLGTSLDYVRRTAQALARAGARAASLERMLRQAASLSAPAADRRSTPRTGAA